MNNFVFHFQGFYSWIKLYKITVKSKKKLKIFEDFKSLKIAKNKPNYLENCIIFDYYYMLCINIWWKFQISK